METSFLKVLKKDLIHLVIATPLSFGGSRKGWGLDQEAYEPGN